MEKIYKCECGKEFTNPQSFNGHKSNCIEHLKYTGKYDYYLTRRKLNYEHTKNTNRKISEKNTQIKLQKWINEKHKCKTCGKVMTEKWASGIYCCRSCANTHYRSKNSKQKTTKSLTKVWKIKRKDLIEQYEKNPKLCLICNKPLTYKHRKGKVCCKQCQNELERRHKIELCAKQGTNLCGKGLRGYYKGFYCQSSWELAYVIYCLDHNISLKRNKQRFSYILDGIERSYFPDFILNDKTYVEIKGYYDRKTKEKEKQFPKELNLIVYKEQEMKPILRYVEETYGKDFVKLYNI